MKDFKNKITYAEQFEERIESNKQNIRLKETAKMFTHESIIAKYSYNFSSLGRPIIQYPQDIVAMQELIWKVKPDLIIETGIAHGGSLIMYASMLALLDMSDAINSGKTLDPKNSNRKVLGVDIDIRAHNREAIEAHPMMSRIKMIEGSSLSLEVIEKVQQFAKDYECVMVCLDSNHTHDHVLAELEIYAPMTSVDSYCVVFDTVVEDMNDDLFNDRHWGSGNNPKTAVWEYLKKNAEFEIDKSILDKLLISVAPDGYLKKIG
jgi:cephalosporin hydroxylase